MPVEFLAFGPHPDDAEIGTGAVLRKMKDLGHTTGIIDMTTGDMGWGTPEQRPIHTITPGALADSEFAAGSMGPKVRAAREFVQRTGRMAAIGSAVVVVAPSPSSSAKAECGSMS